MVVEGTVYIILQPAFFAGTGQTEFLIWTATFWPGTSRQKRRLPGQFFACTLYIEETSP